MIFNRIVADETLSDLIREYYHENRDRFLAYVVLDGGGDVIGFIQIIPDEMYAPFDSFQWWIRNIYVAPEHRRNGIGTSLVNKALAQAKLSGAVQLNYITKKESETQFWHGLGFDIFLWDSINMKPRSISATLRI